MPFKGTLTLEIMPTNSDTHIYIYTHAHAPPPQHARMYTHIQTPHLQNSLGYKANITLTQSEASASIADTHRFHQIFQQERTSTWKGFKHWNGNMYNIRITVGLNFAKQLIFLSQSKTLLSDVRFIMTNLGLIFHKQPLWYSPWWFSWLGGQCQCTRLVAYLNVPVLSLAANLILTSCHSIAKATQQIILVM